MIPLLALLAALQQPPSAAPDYNTSPASGDTVGYWQQRADYRIVATLDEGRGVLSSQGQLTYVNRSPDTLRELYVHQHLNAFRPHSAWSAVDTREGRVRFQNLADPDYAYERFTAVPTIDGVPVPPRYPGAPDSTVVVFDLPEPLAPGDSIRVSFQWDARPSTLPRRQGRRGRSFDFAQWYPRVAVYDRGGWQPNPLVPAGEFYGEFGSFDVTMIVPEGQVIGSTGVPVEGDPGWQRVLRHGRVYPTASSYVQVPPAIPAAVPPGFRRVRFLANDVHHFAWSTSPDYLYEGGVYVREAGSRRMIFPVWDTVAVHVLYRPGDEATWGNGIAIDRTIAALRWLEDVYGPYGYPQLTNLHRIEGGGTEFPMMMMNGSPSQGLILHEGAHIFTHGILANNEWRSGWLDEGLASYQTAWFAGATPQDLPLQPLPEVQRAPGYRGKAVRPDPVLGARIGQQRLVQTGRAEPLGTRANEFSEFAIYNSSVYTRAEIMYGALREVLGDSLFRSFLHDYYSRWAFKHVDELAMRASAERVSGMDLRWFFDQWVRRAGNLDYALGDVDVTRTSDGEWVTRAEVENRGEYIHPMPVGVRTGRGWTVGRTPVSVEDATEVTVRTSEEPLEVRLDPWMTTYDWDRRNDARPGSFATAGRRQVVVDWPFLDQAASDRQLVAVAPWAMYSSPGGYAVGYRVRSNYQGWIDRVDAGITTSIGLPNDRGDAGEPGSWRNIWLSIENPTFPGAGPIDGLRLAAWHVDDAVRLDVAKSWNAARFIASPPVVRTFGITAIAVNGLTYLDANQWNDAGTYEAFFSQDAPQGAARPALRFSAFAGVATPPGISFAETDPYARGEIEARLRRTSGSGRWSGGVRGYLGATTADAPLQRRFRLSSQDPVSSFGNHFLRSAGSPLGRPESHYTPLGGGGLRGYDPRVATRDIAAINLEGSRLLVASDSTPRALGLWLNLFADMGVAGTLDDDSTVLSDAGLGLAVRGMLFDRAIRVRLDAPLYVSRQELAVGSEAGDEAVRFRWTFSFSDLW